jgi:hypothetical protein
MAYGSWFTVRRGVAGKEIRFMACGSWFVVKRRSSKDKINSNF